MKFGRSKKEKLFRRRCEQIDLPSSDFEPPIDVYKMPPVHCQCVFCEYEANLSRPDYWKVPKNYENYSYLPDREWKKAYQS